MMNNRKQPKPHSKPRNHLFSPYTDQCIYCGKSAADDAIENTPCGSDDPPACGPCHGKGWFFFNAGTKESPRYEVQRCDVCERFDSDLAALQALEQALQSQPAQLKFIERIAGLKHGEEPDEDEPFERTSEDYIATLNELILEARELLGTADKCQKCAKTVPYVLACPGGAELCQACFDAGQQ